MNFEKNKRRLSIITIIFILLTFICNISFAATPTLEEIADIFNNCSSVKQYKDYGSEVTATVEENSLIISFEADDLESSTTFTLDDTILSCSLTNDTDEMTSAIMASILIDCIGQFHGYSDGALFSTLNSEQATNYTLENEGYSIQENDDGFEIKTDISKKIPLADFSNTYIEVSDLEDLASFISGSGSAQQSKGNIVFYKFGDDEVTVFIGEKDKLTDNTYNSILSVLKVMFDSDNAVDYFKNNYSNLSVGDKEFSGFNIEINPEKNETEKTVLGNDDTYEFIRLTITKSLVNTAIGNSTTNTYTEDDSSEENMIQLSTSNNSSKPNNSNDINTSVSNENSSPVSLPNAGISTMIILMIIVSTISVMSMIIILKQYKDIK